MEQMDHSAGRREPSEAPTSDSAAEEAVVRGYHADPHQVLGYHSRVLRVRHPSAVSVRVIPSRGEPCYLEAKGQGLFVGYLELPISTPDPSPPYLLEAILPDGSRSTYDDPYRFWPTVGEVDLHLLGEGSHLRPWRVLGARVMRHQGADGVAFAVWAPNARSVRVVGDWNGWDGRSHPMRCLGSSGIWEIFIPGLGPGARYKYEILTQDSSLLLKADPYARRCEAPPGTASIVEGVSSYAWGDEAWMARRAARWAGDGPVAIYEVHLGSWRRAWDGESWRKLTYRELAERLPAYCQELGFTHVELMPVMAHPFEGSWGYQVTSYYAPSPTLGSPDDLRYLIDMLHQAGIGVILDWVPAHFPRDDWALARFDGTSLFEHADPRQGEHPDWGTLVFNLGRREVANFLLGSALFWLEEYHADGLRVDAVASMLYLDYSKREGEWIPNRYGGRENLEAIEFLRRMNVVVHEACPGVLSVAEESTAWPAVSRPTWLGGLGFDFKWNMGWMHDTLRYFARDPVHRRWHQEDLTFGLLYAFSENFVLPLSHDEVVHGKGSLYQRMAGDDWQKRANLRALYAWMWAHPGKKLLFMGEELAQQREWDHTSSIDWHLEHEPGHEGVRRLVADLNRLLVAMPALYEADFSPEGFSWLDATDSESNVLAFLRFSKATAAGGQAGFGSVLACIANFSPVPRFGYRIGLPAPGRWVEVLNTDASAYGGSNVGNLGTVMAEEVSWHGQAWSASFSLPPLGVLWITPENPAS